ncbi:hypothetical protein BJX66DRAFT_335974 [Aspergillus keveii]|uniref:Uncharacterized protein n=1 Tax=Aspergillus keveii TaxID=714993 RepID=A0ABR4GBT0_9EURO
MCRQFLTLYDWCQCEEDAGQRTCGVGKPNDDCAGIEYETARMQCFCNNHATKKFMTEKKHKRKQSRSSTASSSSTSSVSFRSSRYSDVSLDQEKGPGQAPVQRRRWYRLWSRGTTF